MRAVTLGLLVAEGNGPKLKKFVAGVVHVLDVELEPPRGRHRAQLPVRVHYNRHAGTHVRTVNARDESLRLVGVADSDCIAFRSNPQVCDIYVVSAGSRVIARVKSQGGVVVARSVGE